ncbi:MAG: amino acid carrier protein [Pseudomonadota bacterium]
MDIFFAVIDTINSVMLSVPVLVALLATGVLFTLWSGFGQYRSLTHGVRLIRGKVPGISGHGPGALTHFQALSAALSGTVGLGNIAGVAIAIEFGGPGAVFWMWMVGLAGMALKSTEVTLAMLHRDTSDAENPHGGTMYVCRKAFGKIGGVAGTLFTLSVILFAVTGGNMFQAWSVADTTHNYFGVPQWITGLVMAAFVGSVILGGIQRIGSVVGKLVPFMCGIYVLAGLYVLALNTEHIPDLFKLIFVCAFSPAEAGGAFTGATLGMAFIFGMKRALFSSESGLGTAPIAHSAVKTPEPVTEGVVAGLEPFIDTLVVCTITALVILVSGVWQRTPAAAWYAQPATVEISPGRWAPNAELLPEERPDWKPGDQIFVVVETAPRQRERIYGTLTDSAEGLRIQWQPIAAGTAPKLAEHGIFSNYRGATLAARAFDSAEAGLGKWMVTLTVWLFALSTMITYGYYAEQGLFYLGAERWVGAYRWGWCALIALTCTGFINTAEQVDSLSTVALGFMLAVNLPVMWLLGPKAMRAWHDYFRRIKSGEIGKA